MTKDQKQLIDDCLKRQDRLTDWERTFVNNLSNQSKISPDQETHLNKIWDKATEEG